MSYLELIVGPMFSGKTSKLLEIYKQCKFCNINVQIINHKSDTRYDDKLLSSHDKIMAPCIQTEKLKGQKILTVNIEKLLPPLETRLVKPQLNLSAL